MKTLNSHPEETQKSFDSVPRTEETSGNGPKSPAGVHLPDSVDLDIILGGFALVILGLHVIPISK